MISLFLFLCQIKICTVAVVEMYDIPDGCVEHEAQKHTRTYVNCYKCILNMIMAQFKQDVLLISQKAGLGWSYMSLLSRRRRGEHVEHLANEWIRSSVSGRDERSKEQGRWTSSPPQQLWEALKSNQSHLSPCLETVERQHYVNQPVGTATSLVLYSNPVTQAIFQDRKERVK